MAQDDAVLGMLTSFPAITLTGGRLQLSSASLTLTFDEQLPAALTGTRWTTNGRITAPVLSFAGLRNVLVLNADGTWTFSGCGSGASGRYAVADTTLTFTVNSSTSTPGCPTDQQGDEVGVVLQLLQGPVTFTVSAQTLRLVGPDGNGEMFIAEP